MKGHIVYGMMAAAMLAVSVPAYGAQLPAENGGADQKAQRRLKLLWKQRLLRRKKPLWNRDVFSDRD